MNKTPTREEVDLFKTDIICPRCQSKHLYWSPNVDWFRMYCPKPGCNYVVEHKSIPQPIWVKHAKIKLEEMYRKRVLTQPNN